MKRYVWHFLRNATSTRHSPPHWAALSVRTCVSVLLLYSLAVLLVWSPTFAAAQTTKETTTFRYCNFSNPDHSNLACMCPRPNCVCSCQEPCKPNADLLFITKCQDLVTFPSGIYVRSSVVDLSSNQLTTLDSDAFRTANFWRVAKLDVSRNLLTELNNKTLRPVNNIVEEIYLEHNRISKVAPRAFRHFDNVATIDLSHNRISLLPAGVFRDCKKLSTLKLSNNLLRQLPGDFLADSVNYLDLHLDGNHLVSFSPVDFAFLKSVSNLYLQSNRISHLNGSEFPANSVQYLDLSNNSIDYIPGGFFNNFEGLEALYLTDNSFKGGINGTAFHGLNNIETIDLSYTGIEKLSRRLFSHLCSLQSLYLMGNSELREVPDDFLWFYCNTTLTHLDISDSVIPFLYEIGPTCQLDTLEATHTSIASLKWLSGHELCSLCSDITSIDFSDSELSEIDPLQKCTQLAVLYLKNNRFTTETFDGVVTDHPYIDELFLNGNRLTRITMKTFGKMPNLLRLDLSNNRQLTYIHPMAFSGLTMLSTLQLARTSITSLPLTSFNVQLRYLNLRNTKTMKQFPDVELPNLEIADLYYEFHCCHFVLAALHEESVIPSPTMSSAAPVKFTPEEERRYFQIWNQSSEVEVIHFHGGSAGSGSREVRCRPRHNAFTPCEDLLGDLWLRLAAWAVALLALSGNITVILVIACKRAKLDNSRFLVLNLAVADLCLGIYLFIICIVDSTTQGKFSTIALNWQFSQGARLAGFLAVSSTEMSFYTLMLITLERYLTVRFVNKRYRFTPERLRVLAAAGWVISIGLAALPAFEILSSYTKSVLALPFDIEKVYDQAYVGFLLVFNGVSILVISICYAKLYWIVRHSPVHTFNRKKDNQFARRMAVLVFVDLACWLPLAVFGMAATFAGSPLVDIPAAKIFVVFVFPLNSCANPFLYALVTRNFQKDLQHVVKTIPRRVSDFSRRRSFRASPQHSRSGSLLNGIAQFLAQEARKNLEQGDNSAGTSYNNCSSPPPGFPANGGRVNGRRNDQALDNRLARASGMDSSSSSEDLDSFTSSTMANFGERRPTILSFQSSVMTDITECGPDMSEMGGESPSCGEKPELGISLRAPSSPPPVINTLPGIKETSSSSSASDHGHSSANVPVSNDQSHSRNIVTGGLLLSALSAFSPMLVGISSSSVPVSPAESTTSPGRRRLFSWRRWSRSKCDDEFPEGAASEPCQTQTREGPGLPPGAAVSMALMSSESTQGRCDPDVSHHSVARRIETSL